MEALMRPSLCIKGHIFVKNVMNCMQYNQQNKVSGRHIPEVTTPHAKLFSSPVQNFNKVAYLHTHFSSLPLNTVSAYPKLYEYVIKFHGSPQMT
jgi:hypothetical protein